jgi:M6 family metalloprotease-like protein
MLLQFQQNSSKLFFLTAGLIGFLLASTSLVAQGNSQGKADAQAIRNWNTRILQLHAELLNADDDSKASVRAQASPVFQQRAAALAELMETDPQSVLNTAFSADLLETLASDFPEVELEQQGDFSGLAEHIVLDDETLTGGRSDIRMKLDDKWVEVKFPGNAPDVQCNDTLHVRGVKVGSAVAAANGTTSGSAGTISTCSTTGTQYIAVLLVTFPGVTPPSTVTPQMVNDIFFGTSGRSVDNFWRETSQGKTSATGKVFGWFTLDAVYSCDQYYQMRDAAIKAADSSVDFRTFNRIMIVFPSPTGCGWAGLGTLGCSTLSSGADGSFTASVAWLAAKYMGSIDYGVKLSTHEGGHNLGLHHARTFDYGTAPLGALGSTGAITEYGDVFSTMGSWNLGHYSTPNKVRLNWFNQSTQAPTVQTNGVYSIVPFEQATPGKQALRIQRGTGNNAWLWLEYRQPLGQYDSTLGSQVFSGAVVHYEEAPNSYSNLLDFTPETAAWTDPALTVGKTWTDPYSDVSIQVQSATADGLTVAVNYGAAPCVHSVPTVAVSPANPSGLAGSNLTYAVTVTNRDSSGCSPATFLPGSTAPTGWATSHSTSVLTVNPGASATFTMTKTIPLGTPPATYPANVAVSDANHNQSASASATVTTSTCTRAQPTLTLSPSSLSGLPGANLVYSVSVVNNDSSACTASTFAPGSTAPSGWANVFSTAGLTLNPGASGSFTMTKTIPAGTAAATYPVSVSVTTPNHSRSATGSAVVTTPACTRAQPTLTLSPSSLSGLPGANLVYSLSVVNNDSSACTASTFAPSSTAPSGWANLFSTAGLTLNPGASGSFTMTKTIPAGTAAATYSVSASVTTPNHSRSATGSAVVTASTTQSFTATLTGPSTSTVAIRSNVKLTAQVLSGSSPAQNATVTFVITTPSQVSTKTVQTNSQGIATETFKATKAGSYSAVATAILGAKSASTNTIAFTVQ